MTKRSTSKTSKTGTSVFKKFMRDHKGSTAIEYGLIGSLVAVVIIGGVGATRESVSDTFNSIATTMSQLSAAAPSSAPITATSPNP